MKNLQRDTIKPPRMALRPNCRLDETHVPDDGLNAFRGILSACAFGFILIVLGAMIWL